MAYNLAVILPSFNEAENISILISSLEKVLKDISWEAIIVDDNSPDKTAEIAFNISKEKPNIRCFKRIGRKGLASTVIDGMMTNAEYIAVMDTDLQHDESLLPKMLIEIEKENYDIVIGSRFLQNSSLLNFSSLRKKISNIGIYLAHKIIKYDIKNPLSGYFMVKRSLVNELVNSLSGLGFKILLDILASSKKDLKVKELPFQFRERHSGKSKLGTTVFIYFLYLILKKKIVNILPIERHTFFN